MSYWKRKKEIEKKRDLQEQIVIDFLIFCLSLYFIEYTIFAWILTFVFFLKCIFSLGKYCKNKNNENNS